VKQKLYRCEAASVCGHRFCLDKKPHKKDSGCFSAGCDLYKPKCKPVVECHKVEIVVWERWNGTYGYNIKLNPGQKPSNGYKHRKTALRAARRMIERINKCGIEGAG